MVTPNCRTTKFKGIFLKTLDIPVYTKFITHKSILTYFSSCCEMLYIKSFVSVTSTKTLYKYYTNNHHLLKAVEISLFD